MQLMCTGLADLPADFAVQAQVLLRQAFLDGSEDRYTYGPQPPALILLLLDGRFVVGHLALYEREVGIAERSLTIGLIGGVVIAPAHRSQGHCRTLVAEAHRHLMSRRIDFSVLFADSPPVYRSSGYRDMTNTTRFIEDGNWRELIYRGGMVAELSAKRWADHSLLDLRGETV